MVKNCLLVQDSQSLRSPVSSSWPWSCLASSTFLLAASFYSSTETRESKICAHWNLEMWLWKYCYLARSTFTL